MQFLKKAVSAPRILAEDLRARRYFRQHPPIFVVGAPRSGTTLLMQSVGKFPGLSSVFEPYTIWTYAIGDGVDDSYGGNVSLLDRVRLRRGYFARVKSAEDTLLVKDPRDSVRMELIERIIPNCKFINIVRDPRDVVSSIVKVWEGKGYRTDGPNDWVHVRIPGYRGLTALPAHIKAAHMWSTCVLSVLDWQASADDSSRLMNVQYESVVLQPEESLRAVSRFVGHECRAEDLAEVKAMVSAEVPRGGSDASETSPGGGRERWVKSQIEDDAGSGTMSTGRRIGKWSDVLTEEMLVAVYEIVRPAVRRLKDEAGMEWSGLV